MIGLLRSALTAERMWVRLLTAFALLLIVFFSITALSYALLPEGLLRGKNPLHNWETSPELWISTLQIFSFNLLSVAMILFANLFSKRNDPNQSFFPYGYTAFFILISINALILGTWSFSVVSAPVPLLDRFLRTFDLAHRAGLWEMTGQMIIVCATARQSLVMQDGSAVTTRSWRDLRLSRPEITAAALGLALMAAGALIESQAILAQSQL